MKFPLGQLLPGLFLPPPSPPPDNYHWLIPSWTTAPRTTAPHEILPRKITPQTFAPELLPVNNFHLDSSPPDNCPLWNSPQDNYPPDLYPLENYLWITPPNITIREQLLLNNCTLVNNVGLLAHGIPPRYFSLNNFPLDIFHTHFFLVFLLVTLSI